MDGLEVCRQLRKAGRSMPVLMLTARVGHQNVVAGLDSGADDYLTKPFDLEELLARMRALLRRGGESRSPVITIGEVDIDTNSHTVHRAGQVVSLAPREYALLEFLALNRGIAKSRLEIIELVWGEYDELMFSQTVDVHVAYLRRKLGREIIVTVPGKGYMTGD
jgi:DNA-binding response OmpR family regulator